MPRPEPRMVTFTIDGREVTAPENTMLVDAAKSGDVEIPIFCYEPKLGNPVGACRMCLVEVEGIPKLQTGCSTPIKDGMVVHTQTQRVHEAQRAVLEFLLINHPLDCPVCDKGGECPLQDITYGWGPGTSRFIEPKRHFKKPLELSPLVYIDRERCILCYRCVRFSQEISEDYQLILRERGAHTFVSTFNGHPYVAPFAGNITELCPVGALLPRTYRFRARPWDWETSGSVCTMCPSQCNVQFTVRDDRVQRVMARDNTEVDDGWLCDKGRFAYQHVHVEERVTQPMVREGTALLPASWDKALAAAARALSKAGAKTAALAGGETTNEEAFLLQSLLREGLGSGHVSARPGGELPADLARALAAPALQATVPDLEFAHAVLLLDCDPVDDAPILDLRLRKGVRRRGMRLAVASARPTALDANAETTLRFAPGSGEGLVVALAAALAGDAGALSAAATAIGTNAQAVRDLAEMLAGAGEDVVVLYHERLFDGPGGENAARALLDVARMLRLPGRDGAGLLEIPSSANGRGLREAGFSPVHGPGFADVAAAGRDARGIAESLASGDLSTLVLWHADPVRTHGDRRLWESALAKAQTVIACDSVMTDTLREHADVVFPAEAYAEKEGTLVHPDGRLQRLRPAIGRPREVRAGWRLLADLSRACGMELRLLTGPMASARLFEAVPFYAGLTLDEVGGHGLRWQEREAASRYAWAAPAEAARLEMPASAPTSNGSLRLGTFRSLWASKEVDVSPALAFLRPAQVVEVSPVDAEQRGLVHDDEVEVAANGARLRARVQLREAIPAGSVFLREGTREEPANALTEPLVTIVKVAPGPDHDPDADAVISTPAAGPLDPDFSAGGA